jgi:hypothetical protein
VNVILRHAALYFTKSTQKLWFLEDPNKRYDFGVFPLIFLPKCYRLMRRVTHFEHREHIVRVPYGHIVRVPYGQLLMFCEI